jgi:hypothetical protein
MQIVVSKEKPLKTGFSWTILLFSWFFGLPLFSRKLVGWGLFFISMDLIFASCIIDLLTPAVHAVAANPDNPRSFSPDELTYMQRSALHARQSLLAIVVASIGLAFKGNGMAASKMYLWKRPSR